MAIPNLLDFNTVQQLLLDPTSQGKERRDEISRYSALTKTVAGVAIGIVAVLGVVNLVTAASASIFLLGFLTHASVALVCREIFIISGNIVNTIGNDGLLNNLTIRGQVAASAERFVNSIFADTWVAGPLFGTSLVREYEYSLGT